MYRMQYQQKYICVHPNARRNHELGTMKTPNLDFLHQKYDNIVISYVLTNPIYDIIIFDLQTLDEETNNQTFVINWSSISSFESP